MSQAAFGRLVQELQARDTVAGLSMTDILELPDPLRELMQWMLREDVVSLQDTMAQTSQDEASTRSALGTLVDKGLVQEVRVGGETHYKVRIKSRARRALPLNLWRALDETPGHPP
jgi:hypothetical protein